MKLTEKVSWLMGRLQRSLFPNLEQCCVYPLSQQEKHLVKVLEIIEIERHIPKNRQWTGRPAKDEQRLPAEEKRLNRQIRQAAAESLAQLPMACDRGTKENAKGYKESWNGYKLHADVNDTMLPLSIALTSASLHDSQVAILPSKSRPRRRKSSCGSNCPKPKRWSLLAGWPAGSLTISIICSG